MSVLVLGAVGLSLGLYAAASAAEPLDISVSTSPTYFSPNGDEQEDTTTVFYCLSRPANVDVAIADHSGHTVRTLEVGASHNGSDSCTSGLGLNFFEWDGRSDAGTAVADGVYVAHLRARSADADSGDVTTEVGVETRAPGRVVRPVPDDVLSGEVAWSVAPTSGIAVDSVTVRCGTGGGGSTVSTPSADGTFGGTLDVADCTNGRNQLIPDVVWTDPFGRSHTTSALAVPVVVRTTPRITFISGEFFFSPDGDDQEDTATAFYCLSQVSTVGVSIVSASGTVVRTVESGVERNGGFCSPFNNGATWDGKDDDGRTAADGIYSMRVVARTSAGDVGEESLRIGVDTRRPGVLTAPTAGSAVSGQVPWVFTPTAGFSLDTAGVGCGSGAGASAGTSADGRFAGTLDVSDCTNGENSLVANVSWTDRFGRGHSWSAPPLAVTVRSAPQVTIVSSPVYFSPDGDDQDDALPVAYCLTQDADVDVEVADSTGVVVRTLASAAARSGGFCGFGSNNSVEWDGKDHAGRVVGDGVYTVRIGARNAFGPSETATIAAGVDTRRPGALSAPTAGATLSGVVPWTFSPTAGFPVDSAVVSCPDGFASQGTRGDNGSVTGTLDVSTCASGDSKLLATVFWTDLFGRGHSWSASPIAVTVHSVPEVTFLSSRTYISPNGDGQDDSTSVAYCLSQSATVTTTVTAAGAATPVRSLEEAVEHTAASCVSSFFRVEWDGTDDTGRPVPEGVYQVHVRASSGGRGSEDATVEIGVDRRTPGALTAPVAGETLLGRMTAAFAPTPGFDLSRVDLSFDTGGSATLFNASSDGVWRTSVYTGTLRPGPATLFSTVRYRDPFGVDHSWSPAGVPVVVDATTIPLTVTADPATGPAPLATRLTIRTSDPGAGTLHWTADFGDGGPGAGGDVAAPYDPIAVPHTYSIPGAYRAVVTVTSTAGTAAARAVGISVSGGANTPPAATLALSTQSGTAPLPVRISSAGSDADGDALTYVLDPGDGSTPVRGSLPAEPIEHTYGRAGTYLVRLAVSDGKLTTVRTSTVTVALAETLAASAGDDQVVVTGDTVHLDGSGSRPSAGIESYRWSFGDGETTEGASVEHVYATAGTYTATLTVTAGGLSDVDTAAIVVRPHPAEPGLAVTVVDAAGAPVSGADLVVVGGNGQKYAATTGDTGIGHLQGLPDGDHTVYAWKSGYLPASGTGSLTGGAGSVRIALKAGDVATASLTATPLTEDQIVAAGIDPDDPANQHVVEFAVQLAVGGGPSTQVTGYTASGGFPLCPEATGVTVTCGAGGAVFSTGGYSVSVSVSYSHGQPELVWLVIPGKASWLKEFFSVQLMVSNLADPAFTLSHGSATLALPAGLSLAPTAVPQDRAAAVPDIAGGKSATTTWVVRGDVEGRYDLTASYAGSLEPFGDTITIDAATAEPLHVWGASALALTVDADATATARYPYHVTVSLKNVADVPVYNASLELLTEGKQGYIYQPKEQLAVRSAAIAPGGSLRHDYTLVPTTSGRLDVSQSFASSSAGDLELPATITSHPATPVDQVPSVAAVPLLNKVGLVWDAVAGDTAATRYEVFATPADTVDFPAAPVSLQPLGLGSDGKWRGYVTAPAGATAFYALSRNGSTMLHPLTPGTGGTTATSSSATVTWLNRSHSAHLCGETTANVQFSLTDRFGLRSVDFVQDDKVVRTDGSDSSTVSFALGDNLSSEVEAKVTNLAGDVQTVWEAVLDTKCVQERAVVVAMGLNSNLSGESDVRDVDGDPSCGGVDADVFTTQAATNACDGDIGGNLIEQMEKRGYNPGETRLSPDRTLLEFSYNGADVVADCTSSKPTFRPKAYTVPDTYVHLKSDLSSNSTATAEMYVRKLKEYSDCWEKQHGRSLLFSVIGHSEGGYEALALAEAATSLGYKNLISSVVTVDGALHPYTVAADFGVAGCFAPILDVPADVAQDLLTGRSSLLGSTVRDLAYMRDWTRTADRIHHVQEAGVKVATVTNLHDGCLSVDSTINEAADYSDVLSVRVEGNGKAQHAALLMSHRTAVDPGYPLMSVVDRFVPRQGSTTTAVPAKAAAKVAAKVAARTAAVAGGTGRLSGRLASGAGQVVALAAAGDAMTYATVGEDGSFAFDGLPVGSYVLYANPQGGGKHGAWVGGTSKTDATRFALTEDGLDVGTVGGSTWPVVTTTLTDTSGAPLVDGVAVLADGDGHEVAVGRTDEHGTVRLSAPAGTYTVAGASADTAPASAPVTLGGDTTTALRLAPAAAVTATVKDAAGAPISNAVAALYAGDRLLATGVTNSDGTYRFIGLAPGAYSVRIFEGLGRFDAPAQPQPVTTAIGAPGTAAFAISPVPRFTSAAPTQTATVGQAYRFQVTAAGQPTPTFAVGTGRLPAGVTLAADGTLSGTPTAAGAFTFTVVAQSSAGRAESDPYTITVGAVPAFTSSAPPNGTVGVPYSFTVTASGGPSFALASGSLPAGLTLDVNGTLHGTPTAAGTATFAVRATNASGSTTSPAYSLTVTAPATVPTAEVVVHADQTAGGVDVRSPSITTAAGGRLVLAFVSIDGPKTGTQRASSVTGGGLTWSLVRRSNSTGGTAEVWQAYARQPLSAVKVIARFAVPKYDASMTVVTFSNAAVGTSASGGAASGPPLVTVAPAAENALVWAVGHDWSGARTPLPAAGQQLSHLFVDRRVGDTFWTQRLISPAPAGRPIKISVSGITKDRWQLVAVEIRPAVSATPTETTPH